MNWQTIIQQVDEDDAGKWDLHIPVSTLRFGLDGALKAQNNGNQQSYELSEHALTQLCQRLGIPARYFKRLPLEMQAQLANYDLARLAEDRFFLRGKGSSIRAVLSEKYVAYNNHEVIGSLAGAIENSGLMVRNFDLEDRFMFIKLVSVMVADEVLELKTGVMISNSEVGWAQVAVEPFLYRKPCTNDLIVAEEAAFRHRHVDYSAEKFSEKIAESITAGLKLAEAAVARAWAASETPIADPIAEIKRLAEKWRLSEKFLSTVESAFGEEPSATRWGIVNSFTRAAQKLPPVQRIELERQAGRLLAA